MSGGTEKNNIKKEKDTRTPAQKEAFAKILAELHQRYPKATLHGHCEFANMPCPCFNVHEYDYIFEDKPSQA